MRARIAIGAERAPEERADGDDPDERHDGRREIGVPPQLRAIQARLQRANRKDERRKQDEHDQVPYSGAREPATSRRSRIVERYRHWSGYAHRRRRCGRRLRLQILHRLQRLRQRRWRARRSRKS